jgi:hypothetical protein
LNTANTNGEAANRAIAHRLIDAEGCGPTGWGGLGGGRRVRGLLERSGIDRSTTLLVLLPLATGAGLVIHIVTGFSLLAAAGALALVGLTGFAVYWRHLTPPARRLLARRIAYGLVAAAAATAGYDLSRLVISATVTTSVDPFVAWPLFGELLTGAPRTSPLAAGVGFAYHLVNGLGFGLAYVLVFRRPGPVSGTLWGLGLELAMALLYPSWLRIEALREFLTMSVVGHVAYGATLGLVAAGLQGRVHAAPRGERERS